MQSLARATVEAVMERGSTASRCHKSCIVYDLEEKWRGRE